jgi:hypothetical protein
MLAQRGLRTPERPEDSEVPELPVDLAEVSDTVLMRLYNQFTSWTGYSGGELARAVVAEKQAERKLKRVEDLYTIKYKSEKTVAATKAMVAAEDEYQEAEDAVDACFAYRKLVESIYTDCERKAAAASRELSRRISRGDTETRNGKMNV